jgi:hypothetical protein
MWELSRQHGRGYSTNAKWMIDYTLQYTKTTAYPQNAILMSENWDVHGLLYKIIPLAPSKIGTFNRCELLLYC